MKTVKRLADIPTRTPYQDYVAMQARMRWVERFGKFAVALVFLLAALGHIGS